MRLQTIGCSGSYPGPGSPASCYVVQAEYEGRLWSVALDLGNGSLGPMQRLLDPRHLDAVVLSHLHPDHCFDLCSLFVMRTYHPDGPSTDLMPVWGPPGTLGRMIRACSVNRQEALASRFSFRDLTDGTSFVVGPFTFASYRVEHPVEAYGLRVEADGAVLAYSGDTDACDGLLQVLAGADLALVDSAYVDGVEGVRGIHLTGSRAAAAAVAAGGVRRLMLTHIPAWHDASVCRAQAAAVWPGEVEMAEPGRTYEI